MCTKSFSFRYFICFMSFFNIVDSFSASLFEECLKAVIRMLKRKDTIREYMEGVFSSHEQFIKERIKNNLHQDKPCFSLGKPLFISVPLGFDESLDGFLNSFFKTGEKKSVDLEKEYENLKKAYKGEDPLPYGNFWEWIEKYLKSQERVVRYALMQRLVMAACGQALVYTVTKSVATQMDNMIKKELALSCRLGSSQKANVKKRLSKKKELDNLLSYAKFCSPLHRSLKELIYPRKKDTPSSFKDQYGAFFATYELLGFLNRLLLAKMHFSQETRFFLKMERMVWTMDHDKKSFFFLEVATQISYVLKKSIIPCMIKNISKGILNSEKNQNHTDCPEHGGVYFTYDDFRGLVENLLERKLFEDKEVLSRLQKRFVYLFSLFNRKKANPFAKKGTHERIRGNYKGEVLGGWSWRKKRSKTQSMKIETSFPGQDGQNVVKRVAHIGAKINKGV